MKSKSSVAVCSAVLAACFWAASTAPSIALGPTALRPIARGSIALGSTASGEPGAEGHSLVRVPARTAPAAPAPVGTRMAARNGAGCLEAFVAQAGRVWHSSQTAAGGPWSDWQDLKADSAADPVVATNRDRRLEALTVDRQGRLKTLAPGTTATGCGPGWDGNAWVNRGGTLSTSAQPAVVTADDGRLQVIARGKDNSLRYLTQRVAGSVYGEKWNSWVRVAAPSGATLAGSPVAAVNSGGRMQVFVRDTAGAMWTTRQSTPGARTWERWQKLAGAVTASDAAAARNADGRLQVFARGADDSLLESVEKKAGGNSFTAWRKLGTVTAAGNPVVAANADGRLEVFTDGRTGGKGGAGLVHAAQIQPNSSGSWNAWKAIAGDLEQLAAVVPDSQSRLQALTVHDGDHQVWTTAQSAPGAPDDVWVRWSDLGSGGYPCEGAGSIACVNFVNKATGLALTARANGSGGWGPGAVDLAQASADDAARARWRIERLGGGRFQLVNRALELCLTVSNRVEKCGGADGVGYYLEPSRDPAVFVPRNAFGGYSDTCLIAQRADDGTPGASVWHCEADNPAMEWSIGLNDASAPALTELALENGLRICVRDRSRCQFEITGEQPVAYVDNRQCLSGTLVYNDTPTRQTAVLSTGETTGWENTLGGSITLGTEFEIFKLAITAEVEVNYGHSFVGEVSTSVGGEISVPPGEFGWLEKGIVAKKVVGVWTFNGLSAWEEPGESTVPAKDGTDGVSSAATVFRTGLVPPDNC